MSRFKLGLQLYSVRNEMEKDMEGTIKAVAEMGYDCVEFAGYFGRTAEEVREMCDRYGLEIVSVHQIHPPMLERPEEEIRFFKTLGIKYYAIPYVGKEEWEADYDKLIDEFKQISENLKGTGIKLLYHNHDFEFYVKRGDLCVLDSIYKDLGTDVIAPELDMCWVHYSGNDPIEYVKKYGDVEEVLHLKDFECTKLAGGPVYALIDAEGKAQGGDKDSDGFEFRPVGYGRQNVPAIMKAAEDTAIKYVIVEQDNHPSGDALKDAKDSIDYLKSIGY